MHSFGSLFLEVEFLLFKPWKNNLLFIVLDVSVVLLRKFQAKEYRSLYILYMHLTLDTSLHLFRLHSSLTMMRVTCLKELFQFENFEFRGFKCYLYAFKPSNFKDLHPDLRLVHLISSLDISSWHVQNWTPCISSKVCSTHSLNIATGETPSFLASQFQKPWSYPPILQLTYPTSKCYELIGSTFRNTSKDPLFTACIPSSIISAINIFCLDYCPVFSTCISVGSSHISP